MDLIEKTSKIDRLYYTLSNANNSIPSKTVPGNHLVHKSLFQKGCWKKTGASRSQEWCAGAFIKWILSPSAPDRVPTSLYSFLPPSHEPQISGLGNRTKWDMKCRTRARQTLNILTSNQNIVGPQNFTWFWVRKPHWATIFFHGFSLKMGFPAELAQVQKSSQAGPRQIMN